MSIKERPIIFSAPMVNAILEGRKTMTRRTLDPRKYEWAANGSGSWPIVWKGGTANHAPCPYGHPGDGLWVRENLVYADADPLTGEMYPKGRGTHCYSASIPAGYRSANPFEPNYLDGEGEDQALPARSVPSIHMPRWASRIDLEITGVRVERVQEITEADAKAEGVNRYVCGHGPVTESECQIEPAYFWDGKYRLGFEDIWESIHGPGAWHRNDWVWAISLKRVRP